MYAVLITIVSVSAALCLFTDKIWKTHTVKCVANGIWPSEACVVYCAEGYNFSSAMDSVSTYDHEQAAADGNVTITCNADLTWSLTEDQLCEREFRNSVDIFSK